MMMARTVQSLNDGEFMNMYAIMNNRRGKLCISVVIGVILRLLFLFYVLSHSGRRLKKRYILSNTIHGPPAV